MPVLGKNSLTEMSRWLAAIVSAVTLLFGEPLRSGSLCGAPFCDSTASSEPSSASSLASVFVVLVVKIRSSVTVKVTPLDVCQKG